MKSAGINGAAGLPRIPVPNFVSHSAKHFVSNANVYVPHHFNRLHVQVADFEGVLFNELSARFDDVAHQDSE